MSNRQWLIFAACFLIAIALPFLFDSRFAVTLLAKMGIGIIFALSYNQLLGGTGLMSFGHAVYFGSGGFMALHILRWMDAGALPIPIPLLPLAGGLAGLALAALFGLVAARRGATVFAMITLGLGEVMLLLGNQSDRLFGGEGGIDGDRMQGPVWFGLDFAQKLDVYWLILFWLGVAVLAVIQMQRAPMGLVMAAHRENPDRLPALGLDPASIRYKAFCFAGFLAGTAGALFALLFEIMSAEIFSLEESAHILLMASLGGPAPILGPVLGGIVVTLIRSLAGLWSEAWPLYLAILMILVLHLAPGGLSGLVTQLRRRPPSPLRLLGGSGVLLAMILAIELLYRLLLTAPDMPLMALGPVLLDARQGSSWAGIIIIAAAAIFAWHKGRHRHD